MAAGWERTQGEGLGFFAALWPSLPALADFYSGFLFFFSGRWGGPGKGSEEQGEGLALGSFY
jgi:hypothetical protein